MKKPRKFRFSGILIDERTNINAINGKRVKVIYDEESRQWEFWFNKK